MSILTNLHQISFKATPTKYLEISNGIRQRKRIPDRNIDNDYWEIIPNFLVARCPHCNVEYFEQLDIYSLKWWGTPHGEGHFHKRFGRTYCDHLIYSIPFINLLGNLPEVESGNELYVPKRFASEIPHVIPTLLVDNLSCKAVIHSLPICRIEDGEFIPRYMLYMTSYFAPTVQHQKLKQRIFDFLDYYNLDVWGFPIWPFPEAVRKGENPDTWWDLDYWVNKGKLLWLEPDTPDLILQSATTARFPYSGISGRREPYMLTLPPHIQVKSSG